MNPTPDKVTLIDTWVAANGGWGDGVTTGTTDSLYAAMLADPVANPVGTAPPVPAPYTIAGLMGLLSSGSIAALKSYPGIHDLGVDVANADTADVLAALPGLAGLGYIESSEATAIAAAVNATVPDPSWTATVPFSTANAIDKLDIEAARSAAGQLRQFELVGAGPTKGATAFTWASGSSTSSGTTTSLTTPIATANAAVVYGSLVQVGTATGAAAVQIQESPDGGTTWYSPPTKLFTAGLTAATYPFAITLEPTTDAVQCGYASESGGTSSTLTMQLGTATE